MADDTRQELLDYITTLSKLKTRLCEYRKRCDSNINNIHVSPETVYIAAVDGLLVKLNAVNPDAITLDNIVDLADEVTNVIASTEMFINRHN